MPCFHHRKGVRWQAQRGTPRVRDGHMRGRQRRKRGRMMSLW